MMHVCFQKDGKLMLWCPNAWLYSLFCFFTFFSLSFENKKHWKAILVLVQYSDVYFQRILLWHVFEKSFFFSFREFQNHGQIVFSCQTFLNPSRKKIMRWWTCSIIKTDWWKKRYELKCITRVIRDRSRILKRGAWRWWID